MTGIHPQQRFTRRRPCPVCGGGHDMAQGKGVRCAGFLSSDGRWAHCTREERAGKLPPKETPAGTAYGHALDGRCGCGEAHGAGDVIAPPALTKDEGDRNFRAPLPDDAPPLPWERGRSRRPLAVYPWTDRQGRVTFYTLRFEWTEDDGERRKVVTPRTLWEHADGSLTWEKVGPPSHWLRPLFNLEAVATRDDAPVLIVEGEKAALAAAAHFPSHVVTTWHGGAKAVHLADWGHLDGRDVVVWPDADTEGIAAAQKVAELALKAGASIVAVVPVPDDAPAKWDLADEVPSGWDLGAMLKGAVSVEPSDEVPIAPQAPSATLTIKSITATDLIARQYAPPAWAVPGLLPEGLTVLAGRPKMGKSWLALGLCLAVAWGGCALGREEMHVDKGEALYVALEDNERRLQSRLKQMAQEGIPEGLHLTCDIPRFDMGGLAAIEQWLDAHPACKLVVVDTLGRFRPPTQRGSNSYEHDYQVLGSMQRMAIQRGLALVMVTHLRKEAAGDVFDGVSGSMAVTGAADCTWVLTRPRGEGDGSLYITGRDVEEQQLALRFDAAMGAWSILGNAEEFEMSAERRRVVALLRELGEPVSPKDAADMLDVKHGAAKKLLATMCRAGQISKTSRGHYYLPLSLSPTEEEERESGGSGFPGFPGFPGNSGNPGFPARGETPRETGMGLGKPVAAQPVSRAKPAQGVAFGAVVPARETRVTGVTDMELSDWEAEA